MEKNNVEEVVGAIKEMADQFASDAKDVASKLAEELKEEEVPEDGETPDLEQETEEEADDSDEDEIKALRKKTNLLKVTCAVTMGALIVGTGVLVHKNTVGTACHVARAIL